MWLNLRAIKRVMESDGMELDIIVNNKTADNGEQVIQLETAAGAAIQHFRNAHGVNVPRSRFLPVKSTSDLVGSLAQFRFSDAHAASRQLLVTSDLYEVKQGKLVMAEERMFATTPVIKLGDHFKKVANYQARFPSIPSMLELDHLVRAFVGHRGCC